MLNRDTLILLTVLSVIVLLMWSATLEAGEKPARSKRSTQTVTRRDDDDNRRVVKQRRISDSADGPKVNKFEKTVTRKDPDEPRRVELNRRIIRKEDQPTRNIFDKTVTRSTPIGGNRVRAVELNKTVTTVDGERSVDFDRQVTIKHRPQPRPQPPYVRDEPAHFPRGHNDHVCRPGCGHGHYPHGHWQHVCHSGCARHRSGFSFYFFGIGDNWGGGSFYYRSGYDRCRACGGGYYQQCWMPGRWVTCYDPCGRPFMRYEAGYYRTVWIEHTCH